jgi:hypothetical protein
VHAELRKALSLDTDGWHLCHFRDKDQVQSACSGVVSCLKSPAARNPALVQSF